MDLSRYISNFATESFASGDVIFSQGDPGTSMYIVVEGEVDVSYDERRSVRLGVGESFGEMSLIDKWPRSATVIAATDVTLAPISQGLFLVLVHDTPYFALEVMRSLSDRLRPRQPDASRRGLSPAISRRKSRPPELTHGTDPHLRRVATVEVGWRRWDSNPRPPACKAGALAS